MNKQCKVSFNTHSSINVSLWHRQENKSPARKRRATWPKSAVSPLVSQSVLGSEFTPAPLPHPDNWMKLHLRPAQHLSAPGRERESSSLVPLPPHNPSTTEWCPCESAIPLSHQCLLCHSFLPTPSFLSSWFFLGGLKDAGHISMRDLWIDNFLWCLSPASYILQ